MRTLMGFSGQAANVCVAETSTARRNARIIDPLPSPLPRERESFALEGGLALLHEGLAALDVVLALESVEDQALAKLHFYRLAVGPEYLLDDPLPGLDG